MATPFFSYDLPPRVWIHIYVREKEVENGLSCVDRWPTLPVKRHHSPRLPRGGAVARMAVAICAPATDAADNTEATCVTPCFIHKADFNAPCRVLVWVCQHCGNWLIFFAASSCKLTLTYWSCKPHSVSLISLPLCLILCLSVTPSCLSLCLLPCLLLSIFPAPVSSLTVPLSDCS